MNQKICYVHELTDFEKQKANEIMNLGFNTDLLQDRLSYPHDTNLLISLVIKPCKNTLLSAPLISKNALSFNSM